MTKANNALTYCAGCGRLIPSSELQAGLSEARESGVVCISCIERSDPKRAAEIREMSFREAERAKVSVQLMWAPPGVIPPRAARLAGEGAELLAPGAVDPISGDVGEPAPGTAATATGAARSASATGAGAGGVNHASGTTGAAAAPGGLMWEGRSPRRIPWWVIGVASLLMGVLGAVSQRLVMSATAPATVPVPPAPMPAPAGTAPVPTVATGAGRPGTDTATTTPTGSAVNPSTGGQPVQPEPAVPPAGGATPVPTGPATPTGPAATPTPVVPAPAGPLPPTADDEKRAQALLTSADADFDAAPDRAEKLYATILDFYPKTAAAKMAQLRAGDLAAARDRADAAQLQATFDHGMAQAKYDTFREAAADLARIQASAPHGATSKAAQEKLAGILQEKMTLLKSDLAAHAPLIIGEAIDKNELARAAAIVKTIDSFGDATSHATAQAMQAKIDAALAAEAFRHEAPAIRAQLAVAPFLKSFESRLLKWDFAAAGRDLMPAGSEDTWKNAGAGVTLQMQVLTVYFQTRYREALLKRAQFAAKNKLEVTLDRSDLTADRAGERPESSSPGAQMLRSHELHTGTVMRTSADTISILEGAREVRLEWSRLSADSLSKLVQAAEQAAAGPDGAAPAAGATGPFGEDDPHAGADLRAGLAVLALARGEIAPVDLTGLREPWQTYGDLRRVVEADLAGERLARDLRRDLEAQDATGLLYDLRAQFEFSRRYPAPLAFLSPEGRGLLAEAGKFIADHNAGQLLFFQNFQWPDRQWRGLSLEALPMRADQRPPVGQMWIGAKGGTQRVLLRFQEVTVPAGQRVVKAFVRIPVLAAASFKSEGKAVGLDELTGLVPLARPFNPGHVTWEFTDTLHSTRWPAAGAYESDGPESLPGKLVHSAAGDELVFEITSYFASLAKTDYTDPGYGLLIKVLKNEPDYTITLPDAFGTVQPGDSGLRLELQVAPKKP